MCFAVVAHRATSGCFTSRAPGFSSNSWTLGRRLDEPAVIVLVGLRSTLDARFVMYHHVVRRRVEIELDSEFPDPLSAHIDAKWKERLGSGSLFVNDQFVTLIRRPARGKAGLAARAMRVGIGQTGAQARPFAWEAGVGRSAIASLP